MMILDVTMRTSAEGFEFARERTHNALYQDTPILMLTAVPRNTGLDFPAAAGDES